MSIEHLIVKLNCVIWRNIQLPHLNQSLKSPPFCFESLNWYFNVSCKLSGQEEFFEFEVIRPEGSHSYDITSYLDIGGKFEKTFMNLYRSYLSDNCKLYTDQITVLFFFKPKSLSIPSVALKATSVAASRENDSDKCEKSCENKGVYTVIHKNPICSCTDEYTSEKYEKSKESFQSLCLKGLSEDIIQLFDKNEFSDVILKCGEKNLSVHRNILAARSEVFSAMFKHDMSEKNCGVVDIVDLDSDILEQFLRYLYSGSIEEMSLDTAFDLYKAANKYAVFTLKKMCASYVLENMSENIVCKALLLADEASDQEFLNSIASFAARVEGFLKSADWKDFAQKFPSIAIKVYFKYHN